MIKIENLTKDYIGFKKIQERVLGALSFGFIQGKNKFRVLENINLELKDGEILGIIGRNGAGKSTLLKVLSGVSTYETGSIKFEGVLRSILELGVGFNPELSGEENLFYNGLILGYTQKEMFQLQEDIFIFAGLKEFKTSPLKNYSTGMIMRLAFALATCKRPDVLLVDEALSVGDASFQNKCLDKFKQFKKEGTTTILVSHDLNLLQLISDKILVLENGKVFYLGEPKKSIQEYIQLLGKNSGNFFSTEITNDYIENFSISLSSKNIEKKIFTTSEEVELKIVFTSKKEIDDLTVGFHIDDQTGLRVFGTNTNHHNKNFKKISIGKKNEVRFSFPLNLKNGKFSIGVALHEGDNHTINCYFWKDGLIDFEIERIGIPKFDGVVYLPVKMN